MLNGHGKEWLHYMTRAWSYPISLYMQGMAHDPGGSPHSHTHPATS